jgi:hypothetical protein
MENLFFAPKLECRDMSGRQGFILLVAILILVPAGAQAQCTNYENYQHWLNSVEFPDNQPGASCGEGNYAYFVESMAPADLLIYDVARAGNAELLGSIPLPIACNAIAVGGDFVLVGTDNLGATSSLFVFDVSNKSNPVLWGELATGHGYSDVAIDGHYGLAISSNGFFDVIDLGDPGNPGLTYSLATGFTHRRFDLKDSMAYVASVNDGLVAIDYSNPESPYVRSQNDAFGRYNDVVVYQDMAFVGMWQSLIWMIPISSPGNLVGNHVEYGTSQGGLYDLEVALSGDVLYYGSSTGNVFYFTIGQQQTPHVYLERGSGGDISDLQVFDNRLFVNRDIYNEGQYNGWTRIVSVATPEPFEPINEVGTTGTAYAVAQDVGTKAPYLYVADGDAGVVIFDVVDPANPVEVNTVDTPGSAVDIYVENGWAYVADSSAGLQVLDVSVSGFGITSIGSYDTEGTAVKLDVVGLNCLRGRHRLGDCRSSM